MNESILSKKIEYWENRLLDLGKRNKMISFKETKRATLKILLPNFEDLYQQIVVDEKEITFQKAIDRDADYRVYSILSLLDKLSAPIEVNIGDIRAEGTLAEIGKTLKHLRSKSRLAMDEQGTNILYLVFGFIEWREKGVRNDSWIKSPLILVPVSLQLPSINAPYTLKKYDDEVVVNPTLAYLFERDYGIVLPDFDSDRDNLDDFMQKIEDIVDARGWRVHRECSIGLVSFLKISMYNDLVKNTEQLMANPIVRAFAGEKNEVNTVPDEVFQFDHDECKAMESYQVLDADSSQQDAIMLSKRGVSFVMQGPPGTGKSQTITNIIAQGLADGKKILFVSEKMAALDVVYRRLMDANLADFCLSLHSHKANKREILTQLEKNLTFSHIKVKDEEIAKLTQLDMLREQLRRYVRDIHTQILPIEMSLYEVYGAIIELRDMPDIAIDMPDIDKMSKDQVNRLVLLVSDLDKAKSVLGPQWYKNPWQGIACGYLEVSEKRELEEKLGFVIRSMGEMEGLIIENDQLLDLISLETVKEFWTLCEHAKHCVRIPHSWYTRTTESEEKTIRLLHDQKQTINKLSAAITEKFDQSFFEYEGAQLYVSFNKALDNIRAKLRHVTADAMAYEQLEVDNSCIQSYLEVARILLDAFDTIKREYNLPFDATIRNMANMLCVCGYLLQKRSFTEHYFGHENQKNLGEIVDQVAGSMDRVLKKREWLFQQYSTPILNDVQMNSVFKRLTEIIPVIRGVDAGLEQSYSFYRSIADYGLEGVENAEYALSSEASKKFVNEFRVSLPGTLQDVRKHLEVLPLLQKARYVPGWEKKYFREKYYRYVEELSSRYEVFQKLKKQLDEYFTIYGIQFDAMTFDRSAFEVLQQVHYELPEAKAIISASLLRDAYSELEMIDKMSQEYRSLQMAINMFLKEHAVAERDEQLLLEYLHQIRVKVQDCDPIEAWIDDVDAAIKLIEEIELIQAEVIKQRNELGEVYEEAIFELDYASMLNRFKAEYTGFLKHFKGTYRADIKQIRLLHRTVKKKITDDEIVDILQKLREYHEKIAQYNTRADKVAELLGIQEYKLEFRWNEISERINRFNEFCEMFTNRAAAYQFLHNRDRWDCIMDNLCRSIELKAWFASNERAKEYFATLYKESSTDCTVLREMMLRAKDACKYFKLPEDYLNFVTNAIPDYAFTDFEKAAGLYLSHRENLNDERDSMYEKLGIIYSEDGIEWKAISEALESYGALVNVFGEDAARRLIIGKNDYSTVIAEYQKALSVVAELANVANHVFRTSDYKNELQIVAIQKLITSLRELIVSAKEALHVFDYLAVYGNNRVYDLSMKELKRALECASFCKHTIEELATREDYLKSILGKEYQGFGTNWSVIRKNLQIGEEINSLFGEELTNELISAFVNATAVYNEMQMKELLAKLAELTKYEEVYRELSTYSTLEEKQKLCEELLLSFSQAIDIKRTVNKVAYVTCDYDSFVEGMRNLSELQKASSCFAMELQSAQEVMPFLGLSEATDWPEVVEMFDHIKQIKRAIAMQTIDGSVAKWLTNAIDGHGVNEFYDTIKQFVRYLDYCYDIVNLFETKDMLEGFSLSRLLRKYRNCREYFAAMDAWIDYRDCKTICSQNGLHDFAMKAEDVWYPAGCLKDVFLKSFYYAWFESVCKNIDSVANFRVRAQESRVNSFRELDAHLLPVDQMRIREKLIRAMPTKDSFSRATDEMSVLLHELGKKRNIMPLRKLFRAIPNLLLKLKPCLMMSPLSVSYFLEADTYRFDMVIFDEASQIFPQDAIGAIFRGSQVIVAGDSKQLPPTNFFAASTSNDMDYDLDEDYEEEIVFDSILEEATNSLPNRSLLWHYRSRYEDLISYSNQEIYQNNLITFPSSTMKIPDTGVEYIFVERGVYENRCNKAEASEIVRLIKEHIQNHPERSLGVIAFSESQQSVIEDAIHRFRAQNPFYEYFFDENVDEPFFVKNLENVQGDERDTIIFSICYGKNAQGRMYMRFGPLGSQGGERRLNVAITRAKHNVKLVGSILPDDIDLSKTKSEGVKMLRGYINYALYGNKVLTKRSQKNKLYDVDIFSVQIGEFLTSKGYKVHMNIGNSDYTVDVALEHPTKEGVFFAGIECDGNTYYMARTVRDREHLRTSVLKRMGWRMHRVWSTEWIRNPRAEQERLLAFVENALKGFEYHEAPKETFSTNNRDVEVEVIKQQPSNREEFDRENPYNFDAYTEGSYYNVKRFRGHDSDSRLADMIHEVVRVEQPIHIDLLSKRLASAFGSRSVTQGVKDSILGVIGRAMKGEVVIEDRFARLCDMIEVIARRSPAGMPDRNIDHISTEEIAAAMRRILIGAFGMERSVLCSEAAKVFGFERSGAKIRQRTNEAVDYLVVHKIVSDIDDKIQLLEGGS